MKIHEVKLCVNCEEVFSFYDSKDGRCPACGSAVTFFVNQAWTNQHSGKIEMKEDRISVEN